MKHRYDQDHDDFTDGMKKYMTTIRPEKDGLQDRIDAEIGAIDELDYISDNPSLPTNRKTAYVAFRLPEDYDVEGLKNKILNNLFINRMDYEQEPGVKDVDIYSLELEDSSHLHFFDEKNNKKFIISSRNNKQDIEYNIKNCFFVLKTTISEILQDETELYSKRLDDYISDFDMLEFKKESNGRKLVEEVEEKMIDKDFLDIRPSERYKLTTNGIFPTEKKNDDEKSYLKTICQFFYDEYLFSNDACDVDVFLEKRFNLDRPDDLESLLSEMDITIKTEKIDMEDFSKALETYATTKGICFEKEQDTLDKIRYRIDIEDTLQDRSPEEGTKGPDNRFEIELTQEPDYDVSNPYVIRKIDDRLEINFKNKINKDLLDNSIETFSRFLIFEDLFQEQGLLDKHEIYQSIQDFEIDEEPTMNYANYVLWDEPKSLSWPTPKEWLSEQDTEEIQDILLESMTDYKSAFKDNDNDMKDILRERIKNIADEMRTRGKSYRPKKFLENPLEKER